MSSEARITETSILQMVHGQAPERNGSSDIARMIIGRLSELPIGSGVEYKLTSDVKGGSVRSACTNLAFAAGIGMTMKFNGDVLRVWRIEPKKRMWHSRVEEIVVRRMEGETLESIAADLRITRERVRQISSKYEKFSELPIGDRIKAVNDFIAPFIHATPDSPACIICGKDGRRVRGVCKECGKFITAIQLAAARIRGYRSTGLRHYLAKATMVIKRHNLTPEDMRKG